jgi:large subunit ribosomal protein L28
MPRKCQITGKSTQFGNNVSHSHRKTRRKWKANILNKRIYDETTGRWVKMKISARSLRTLNKKGYAGLMKSAK